MVRDGISLPAGIFAENRGREAPHIQFPTGSQHGASGACPTAWRRRPKPQEATPEPLWRVSVRSARGCKPSPVAQAVRVDYSKAHGTQAAPWGPGLSGGGTIRGPGFNACRRADEGPARWPSCGPSGKYLRPPHACRSNTLCVGIKSRH
jgi:hypothetical protein